MTSQTPIPPDSSVLVLSELKIPGRTGPTPSGAWGINIAAAQDNFPRQGLQCQAGPWGIMGVGDKLVIFWGDGNQVLQETVDQEEKDKELTLFIPAARIAPGAHNVSYSVTRLGGIAEPSEVMQVFVKLTRPGGQDQNGDTPGHSELHMVIPQEILDGGIDKDNVTDGVPITILAYPHMAVGDVIQVTWGGKFVLSEPLTEAQVSDPANNPIVVLIDEATLRAAGDSDSSGLGVAFEVYDVVDNRSEDWCAEQRVVVAVDQTRLTAPIVKDALNNVLDLDKLGDANATVQILAVDNNFKLGDIIVLRVRGTPLEGAPVDLEIEGEPLDNVPSIPELKVPNAVLKQLAKTQVVFSYRLKKADSSAELQSKGQFVRVIGEIQRLQAPIAEDAQQGAIDPELPRTRIEIPFDPSFAAGQALKLFWLGTRPDFSTYLPDLGLRPISNGDIEAGESLFITVEGEHLTPIKGGTLELYYQLLIEDTVLATFNRVNATHAIRESEHLAPLNVGEPRLELPEPEVEGVLDGALDPDLPGTKLTVKYLQTVKDDEVTYEWVGSKTGKASDSVTLSSFTAGQPVPFSIKAELIKGNEGGTVKASYFIKRAAGGGTSYSNALDMQIGEQQVQQLIVIGHRSQAGPHYHSNLSRLTALANNRDQILWTYAGDSDSDGLTGQFFLDTEPERALIVALQNDGKTLSRQVLRPSNMTGVFNLENRHSGCIIRDDGTVFGWSDNDEMRPPPGAVDVRCVTAGGQAYAALKKDATVIAWGAAEFGGAIAPEIEAQLKNVKKLASSAGAFVAVLDDGSLVAWGNPDFGGRIPPSVISQLTPALQIIGNTADFSVLLLDGRVLSWGATWPEGLLVSGASGATRLCASDRAFSALKADRSVFAWGSDAHGGTIPVSLVSSVANVTLLASSSAAFAALKMDGSLIAWGNSRFGGDAPGDLRNVKHVVGSTTAFCALKEDGSLTAWGDPAEGGQVPEGLGRVLSLAASYGTFSAVLEDYSAISWGVNASSVSQMPVVCVYPAGSHLVALGEQKALHAWGPNAPDLEPLTGEVSYTE